MELATGNVTNVEVESKTSYSRDDYGSNVKTYYTTYFSLDNGLFAWFDDKAPIALGDALVTIGQAGKKGGRHGTEVLAFYNLTQNLQRPTRAGLWWLYAITGFIFVFGIAGIYLREKNNFLVLVALVAFSLGIFSTYKTYQRARALNKVKTYLLEQTELLASEASFAPNSKI